MRWRAAVWISDDFRAVYWSRMTRNVLKRFRSLSWAATCIVASPLTVIIQKAQKNQTKLILYSEIMPCERKKYYLYIITAYNGLCRLDMSHNDIKHSMQWVGEATFIIVSKFITFIIRPYPLLDFKWMTQNLLILPKSLNVNHSKWFFGNVYTYSERWCEN